MALCGTVGAVGNLKAWTAEAISSWVKVFGLKALICWMYKSPTKLDLLGVIENNLLDDKR